jgi:ubiquinone biosynthesis protein UbiJ
MPATPAWLASAEALLNRCIGGSAQAAALARTLEGTSLAVEVASMTRIRAAVSGGRVNLFTGEEAGAAQAGAAPAAAPEVNATVSGTLPALLQMFNGTRNAKGAVPGRAAQIRGDAEIADRYRELFLLARPDPEEELSRWIGDFPARRLSQFAGRALEAMRRVRRTAGENIAEYLQEEGRDLVNKTELEEFLRGVDSLRDTADRIDARLKHLEQRIKGAA